MFQIARDLPTTHEKLMSICKMNMTFAMNKYGFNLLYHIKRKIDKHKKLQIEAQSSLKEEIKPSVKIEIKLPILTERSMGIISAAKKAELMEHMNDVEVKLQKIEVIEPKIFNQCENSKVTVHHIVDSTSEGSLYKSLNVKDIYNSAYKRYNPQSQPLIVNFTRASNNELNEEDMEVDKEERRNAVVSVKQVPVKEKTKEEEPDEEDEDMLPLSMKEKFRAKKRKAPVEDLKEKRLKVAENEYERILSKFEGDDKISKKKKKREKKNVPIEEEAPKDNEKDLEEWENTLEAASKKLQNFQQKKEKKRFRSKKQNTNKGTGKDNLWRQKPNKPQESKRVML